MSADAFTRANWQYRQAIRTANRPHPVMQIGERPIGWADVAIHLPALACVALCLAPPVITFIIIGALQHGPH